MDHVKTCLQCWQAKPRMEFYKNDKTIDGLQTKCKSCVDTNHRIQRVAMREENGMTVRTHLQGCVVERRRMGRGLTETAYKRNRPKYKFNVPDWMLPKNGIDIWSTLTASIVWGICGRMADMPEYE